jgi:hypothetical protein
MSLDPKKIRSEIIMYTHQSVNIYYYKYTVDGMNIILVSILLYKNVKTYSHFYIDFGRLSVRLSVRSSVRANILGSGAM